MRTESERAGERDDSKDRVSALELFFDLVFVFVITQLASVLDQTPTWTGAVRAVLELSIVYWMYGGFAWLTNAFGTDGWRLRLTLLGGMAAFFVVSLAVPRAFASDAFAFGIAYAALTAVHLAGFLLASRGATFQAMIRLGATNVIAAALILAAAGLPDSARWTLWLAAALVQWTPALAGVAGSFEIGVEHFAERHGLMIIIVLGESIVSVAQAAQHLSLTGPLIAGTLCGLAAAAAMWWCYFGGDDEAGAIALRHAPARARATLALVGYDLSHVLMMAGVVAAAAGARLSLPILTHATNRAAAVLIAAGPAVYLCGLAAFRATLKHGKPTGRLAAAVLTIATVPIGTYLGAAQQLLGVAIILTMLIVVERRATSTDER